MIGKTHWQSWDTARANGNEVDYWSDVVVKGVIDASMKPVARDHFDGCLSSRSIGATRFVSFRSQSHQINRTVTQAGNGDGHVMVGLQLRGLSFIEQGEAKLRLTPGQIALVDSGKPFNLHFPDLIERRLVLVPRSLLGPSLDVSSRNATPHIIKCDNGAAQVARDALLRLTDMSCDWSDQDCSLMMQALVHLLRISLDDRAISAPVSRLTLADIRTEMQARLSDERLNPATIARSFGISVRSLYRLFAQKRLSFSQLLLELRLDHARTRIENDAAQSLTAIALESGLNDSAHFSRAYRAQFGEAPSQTRARFRSKASIRA